MRNGEWGMASAEPKLTKKRRRKNEERKTKNEGRKTKDNERRRKPEISFSRK